MKFVSCIFFALAVFALNASETQEIEGDWTGVLDLGVSELSLNVHLSLNQDELEGSLSCPEQNFTLPIEAVNYHNSSLSFKVPQLLVSYQGTLTEGEIIGTFTQAKEFPLILKKGIIKAPVRVRPQVDAVNPNLYVNEELFIKNGEVTLAGTLTLPKGKDSFTTVIFIAGSGPHDRDENILGHKPFLVISDHLARHGIASLRLDKRGVGASTGNFEEATCADFVKDTQAAIDFIKKRKEVHSLGLLGHSEGGMLAPEIANSSPDIDFIILLAGTGAKGSDVLVHQSGLILKAEGASPEKIQEHQNILTSVIEVLQEKKDVEEAIKRLSFKPDGDLQSLSSAAQEEWEAQVNQIHETLKTPWFQSFLNYDPRQALSNVDVPVLALNGSLDLQVCPKQNLREIEKTLKEGKNPPAVILELKGLNHLFQTAKTGSPNEYIQIEETIAPEILELISNWIQNSAPPSQTD
ncbi:MAG: alpha/beta hydrolase [Simkaniaceae bacterium]|nr:MAG: alpha/beta hydrolase [Simkaniaceae bacterium]